MTGTDANAEFLEAFGISSEATQDNQSNSGVNANPDAQDSDATSTDVNDTDNQAQDSATQTDSSDNQTDTQPTEQQSANARANQAFAQMRTENASLKRLIGDIAEVLGIDANTPQDQMNAAVQNAVLQAQAKKQGIDPAVLQRLTQLEQYKEQNERQSFTNKALMGFQNVKNQFNLSDKELDAFADLLIKDGVNPFVSDVNLVSEYKLRNFDSLIAAAEKRGAAQEATRQQNVAAHSTSPSKNTGASSDNEPDKVNTTSGLTKWFDDNTK